MNPVRIHSNGMNSTYNKWFYSKKALLFFVLFVIVFALTFMKKGGVSLLILNLSLIPIVVAALEYGYAFSYLISVTVSVVIFVTMIYNPGFRLSFLSSAIFLNLLPLTPGYYNRIYKEYRTLKNSTLQKTKSSFDEFTTELKVSKDLNVTLENQVSEILGLYEVTKKMSASLDMSETLRAFKDEISQFLKFSKLELILIDETQESPVASIKYEILTYVSSSADKATHFEISKKSPSQFDQILVATVSARKEAIYLKSPVEDAHPLKQYLHGTKEPFAALPLLSEEVPIGILTIYGAQEEQLGQFSIMAEQLALEVKKISLYEKIQTLAITDGLTNIYVRRHFLERLNEEVARSKRHKLKLSLLMIDIDHFKQCNDTYGHLVGDIVLKDIARIMKEQVRQVDLVGRYGGEEFVIALPDTNKTLAAGVAERLKRSVENHKFRAYDETIATTISIGLATYPDDNGDVTALIDRADQALYKAKAEGRNRVCGAIP